MPTIYPKLYNVENADAKKFSIKANDPELLELFEGNRGNASFGIAGSLEDPIPGVETGDIGKTLSGTYDIIVNDWNLGSADFSGGTSLEVTGLNDVRDKLKNLVTSTWSDDWRDQKAGDDSYDADHITQFTDVEEIMFQKTSVGSNSSSNNKSVGTQSSNMVQNLIETAKNNKMILAGAGIVAILVIE